MIQVLRGEVHPINLDRAGFVRTLQAAKSFKLENQGFWEAGSYKISYQSTDSNGNSGTKERNFTVQDNKLFPIWLFATPHQFLANPSISLTSYQDSSKTLIDLPPLPAE